MIHKLEKHICITEHSNYYNEINYLFTEYQIRQFEARGSETITMDMFNIIVTRADKFSKTQGQKLRLMLLLLESYPSVKEKDDKIGTCRVMDLLPFFVDDTRILAKKLQDNYPAYKKICTKLVKANDEVFDLLLKQIKIWL